MSYKRKDIRKISDRSKNISAMRPTENRVKKAVFDILGDISGLSFLDLFAGSGSVGIEAVLRGAEKVVLVENNKRALSIAKKEIRKLANPTFVTLMSLDAFRAIARLYGQKEIFEVVFLDPPYYKDMVKKTLQILDTYDILTHSGIICVQHYKKDILPENLKNLSFFKQYKYGDTRLSVYRKVDS